MSQASNELPENLPVRVALIRRQPDGTTVMVWWDTDSSYAEFIETNMNRTHRRFETIVDPETMEKLGDKSVSLAIFESDAP